MSIESSALLMGVAMGALGGGLAGLGTIFGGFKSLAGMPAGNSRRDIASRASFLCGRIGFGAGLGFLLTFGQMDKYLAGVLTVNSLAFSQAAAGLFGPALILSFFKAKSLPQVH